MELSRNSVDETKKRPVLGQCQHFFWLGVVFDTVGATALFAGAFTDLLHHDLLLYLGCILVVLSLLWWVFWCAGNVELTPEEAWKRPAHLPSPTVLDTLRQHASHSFCLSFGDVSTTFMRIRRLRSRKRFSRRAGPLLVTVTRQTADRIEEEEEDKDQDGVRSVRKRSDAEDRGREAVGPEPEAAQSSGVCPPGPDAGPLGPEPGRPTSAE